MRPFHCYNSAMGRMDGPLQGHLPLHGWEASTEGGLVMGWHDKDWEKKKKKDCLLCTAVEIFANVTTFLPMCTLKAHFNKCGGHRKHTQLAVQTL